MSPAVLVLIVLLAWVTLSLGFMHNHGVSLIRDWIEPVTFKTSPGF